MEKMTLEKISEKLKFERLDKDFTLEQVSKHTKILKKFIIAIEAGDFKVFPSNTYLYGFVTNLCDLYQIDDQAIVANLKEEIEKEEKKEKKSEETSDIHLQDKEQPLFRKRSHNRVFIIIIAVLVFFILILSINFSFNSKDQVTSITSDNVVTQTIIYKMNNEKETFDLKTKDEVNILFDGSYQKLIVKEIKDSQVSFYLNELEFFLLEEGDISMDVNEDATDDIKVRLKKISGELAIVHIDQINYKDKLVDYQRIWNEEEHVLVETDHILFKNQEKKPIEVYVKATKLPSHLSYHLDGRRQNTTMLGVGKDIIISAEEHLEVIIGNYRSVIFIVNKIPINLTLDNDKHSVTKIIKWIPDANNNTKFDLIIKDYVN